MSQETLKMFKEMGCALCGGKARLDTTTFSVDYGIGVLVVRQVPALVCEECGESWISDEISEKLEHLVTDARDSNRQIEVIDLVA